MWYILTSDKALRCNLRFISLLHLENSGTLLIRQISQVLLLLLL